MYYTVLVILIWLLLGAHALTPSFNPEAMAFLLAIILDLWVYKPWTHLAHPAP